MKKYFSELEHRLIKNTKSLWFPSKLLFFDCETRPVENVKIKLVSKGEVLNGVKHEAFLIISHLYKLQNGKYKFVEEQIFYDKIDFTRYVLRLRDVTCISHSLSFDFRAGIDIEEIKRNGYYVKKFSTENGRTFFVLKDKSNTHTIRFVDSINYFTNVSIEEIGKIINLQKLKMPSYDDPIEKWIKYCRRDVEILAKACLHIFNYFIGKTKFCYTMPSFSFLLYRRKFMNEKIYGCKDPRVVELERAAYYGGRVECFKLGKIENVYYLDINSLYPYVMLNPMPVYCDKYIEDKQGNLLSELQYYLSKYPKVHVIAEVDVDVPDMNIPPFPYRTESKLIFPIGKFRTYLASPELLLHPKFVKKCYKIAVYRTKVLFDKYVKYFYEKKEMAKKKNDKTSYLIYKLILNSLYGKFAQRINQYKLIGNWHKPIDHFLTRKGRFQVVLYKLYHIVKNIEGYYNSVAIPVMITSLGRAYLYQIMQQCDEVYYCDTDGIMTNEKSYLKLKRAGYVSDNELGKLKLENIYKYIIIKGNKYYITPNFTKLKGVPKKAKQVAENKFVFSRVLGFKEEIRRLSKMDIVFVDMYKELKNEYDKRIVLQDLSTKPIKIS